MILAMVKMELIVQTSLKTQFYQKEQFALNYADFLLYYNANSLKEGHCLFAVCFSITFTKEGIVYDP